MILSCAKVHDLGIHFEVTAEGVRITDVAPDSPAKELGFEPGDVILSVYGHPVNTVEAWNWLTSFPNDYAELHVKDVHTGSVVTRHVSLGQ